ncbi:unnamed protein product [Ixodes pacificus]
MCCQSSIPPPGNSTYSVSPGIRQPCNPVFIFNGTHESTWESVARSALYVNIIIFLWSPGLLTSFGDRGNSTILCVVWVSYFQLCLGSCICVCPLFLCVLQCHYFAVTILEVL